MASGALPAGDTQRSLRSCIPVARAPEPVGETQTCFLPTLKQPLKMMHDLFLGSVLSWRLRVPGGRIEPGLLINGVVNPMVGIFPESAFRSSIPLPPPRPRHPSHPISLTEMQAAHLGPGARGEQTANGELAQMTHSGHLLEVFLGAQTSSSTQAGASM